MNDLSTLLLYAAVTAFSFFVAAPMALNAISAFTVQARFAEAMVKEGVIKEAQVKEMLPKKQIAGVIIAVICLAAALFAGTRTTLGLPCFGVGFLLGLLKYRDILKFNSLTVKRFQNTFRDQYNAEKMSRYVKRMF